MPITDEAEVHDYALRLCVLDVAQELLSNHALTLLNAYSIFQRRAARYVASLAMDINQLRKHMKEPEKLMGNFGLSHQEMAALQSKHSGRIRMSLKANSDSIAQEVAILILTSLQNTLPKAAKLKAIKMERRNSTIGLPFRVTIPI